MNDHDPPASGDGQQCLQWFRDPSDRMIEFLDYPGSYLVPLVMLIPPHLMPDGGRTSSVK